MLQEDVDESILAHLDRASAAVLHRGFMTGIKRLCAGRCSCAAAFLPRLLPGVVMRLAGYKG
eukprot:6184192-Pleurochrysis_carterae.AAC.3